MKKYIFFGKDIIEIIPFLEICIGLLLLMLKIRSIYVYNEFLYSIPEGLKELIDYELMRYGDVLLWSVSIFAGCSYWVNKKVYWIFSSVFLCILFVKVGLSLWFYDIRFIPIVVYILSIYIFVFFLMVQIKLFQIKEIKTTFIGRNVKLLSIIVSFIACFIYWYLDVIYPFL